ncbi:MAG: excisionase [Oscillospiraceae bacterium]|nr:molybdate-binding protein [Oscillospiraceae bacterium]MDD6355973.1 excisionase [Oscillospiraceae bacterium]
MEKVLMSIKEVCKYTGWGMTKTREILKRSDSDFTIRVGNRLYVNKQLFDDYLVKCAKNKTDI